MLTSLWQLLPYFGTHTYHHHPLVTLKDNWLTEFIFYAFLLFLLFLIGIIWPKFLSHQWETMFSCEKKKQEPKLTIYNDIHMKVIFHCALRVTELQSHNAENSKRSSLCVSLYFHSILWHLLHHVQVYLNTQQNILCMLIWLCACVYI